jgi:hypothetical protein
MPKKKPIQLDMRADMNAQKNSEMLCKINPTALFTHAPLKFGGEMISCSDQLLSSALRRVKHFFVRVFEKKNHQNRLTMPFSFLWNASLDHDPPKVGKIVKSNLLPNFGEAVRNPDLAVVSILLSISLMIPLPSSRTFSQHFVLNEQKQRKAAWWKKHARLQAPDKVPCNTLCEIIKGE